MGGLSTTSTPVTVNVNPFYNCYCTPVYTVYDNDYISNVTLNTINNTTGYAALPGYTDYSGTLQTNLLQGQSYTLNVTNGGGYSEYIAAWIDFDHDGIFGATEQLISQSTTSGATASANFTVPMSALSGITRLRVTLQYGGTGTPCPTSGYGEAEDYGIMIVTPTPCSGTPAPGNTVASVNPACFTDNLVLSTSNAMTDLGLTFDWQTSPDGITWTSSGVTTPTYSVNQSAATYYQCVVTCTNSGLSGTSTPVLVNQVVCFCTTPLYSYNALYDMCSYYNYIGNFTFAGINNTTVCDNTPPYYNYYSGMTATVNQTGSYQVTISATPGGASFQLYKVYIDYNDNGSFDDAGEMVYTSGFISSATNFSQGNIIIPLTAPLGTHRLRVRSTNPLNSGYDANSCSDDGYLGEVEDYNITINPAPPCSGTPTPGATLSNRPLACASTTINLSLENVTPGTGVTYQWQSSPDAGFATPTNLGTAETQTATQTATTYYRCLVTCSGNTGISTPVMVYYTTNCYCVEPAVVSDGCALGLYINNVTFAGINNTSGCYNPVPYTYPYYSFFPSQTAAVTQGGVYPFSVSTPTQSGGYYQWFGVWIDYNDNGSFEDAGELVLSSVAGGDVSTNTLTGNITIPLSSTPGVHLMRVRSGNVSAAINSCTDNAVSGETEDYLIDITAAPACAGTPNPGNTLSTDLNVCSTDNITLSLQNNPIETGYSYQWQVSTVSATGPWTNVGTNANTYSTSQTVTTWYQCVVTCANGGASAASTPVQVNQNGPTACYCTPSYTSYDNDYISNVTLNTINNTTGYAPNPSYTDYSSTIQTTLIQGNSYTISVTNGGGYTEYVGAWIDFNQDGAFDAGEQILNTTAGSGLAVSNSFTVPLSAVSGNTVLRVTLQYGSAATPCPTSGWGEAEDYGIILGDPNCISSPIAPANASLICPDPGLVLSWPSMSGATGYNVYFDAVDGTTLVSPNQAGTTYNPGTLVGTGPFYWKVVPIYPSSTCSTPIVWSFSLKPAPIPVASSGGDVCQGADIYLTGDNVDPGQSSGNVYSWTGPNGFTSSDQNPIIYGPGPVNSGTYTMVVTNQFGCSGTSTTTVNVNPNPTLTIISQQDVGCIGGSDGSVTIGASGGTANYDFTADFVNFFNDPSQATIGNLPEGTTVVYVSDANACLSTIPVTLGHISTVPPSQNVIMPFAGMPGNACPGTTANLSIPAVAGATLYTWDGPPGTTFDGNPSPYISTTPSVAIVFGTPSTSLYQIGVQAGNGCGNSIRKIQKVRYSVSVPSAVIGDATVCANTNGKVYSIPEAPEGATEYQWTITGDASINGQGNTVTTTALNVTVDFGPSWTGGTLCVAAKTSCYTSAYKCFPISTASGNFGIITGSFTACANTIENYSVSPGPGVATYNWTVPANTSISSGQGTNSISVFFQPGYNNVGPLCVTATSICGVTSAPKCKTLAPSLPSRPASISGINNGLCGSTNVTYSTPAISGVTYSWTVPAGATITSGNGTNSIKVNFGTITTGQICVKTHNACGFSLDRCITVKGAPNKPSSITADPSTWCAYDAGIEFTANVSNITGIYSLSWSYPNSTTYVQGGGNSTSLTLDWGGTNGVVMVTSSNACGNGTATYSSNLSCRESEMSASALNVYPNPTAGMLNVEYTTEKGTAQVTVLDLSGRVVMTQTQPSVEGKNTMQLDLSKVAKGAYMLNVQTQSGNNQVRIVVE
ncbi:MAG: GEVED domain-containing protein [Bacteroidia bacterium]